MKRYGLFFTVGLVALLMTAITPLVFSDGALAQEGDAAYYRVFFSDRNMANQLFRAFEGEMVETNYDAGYHIILGEPDALERLEDLGLDFAIEQDYTPPLAMLSLNPLLRTIPGYSCYETVEETYAAAQAMATGNPTLASWTDVGNSWEKNNGLGGYDMMVLKLTNTAITGDKPKLFLTCALHAREYTTAGLCLTFAQQLVDDYDVDADTTWILDHHEIHFMLHANPDGR
ncbi:MAG: carboxypeptidase, partial [bacterium]|nr:carboxypeptidase [bacterium]